MLFLTLIFKANKELVFQESATAPVATSLFILSVIFVIAGICVYFLNPTKQQIVTLSYFLLLLGFALSIANVFVYGVDENEVANRQNIVTEKTNQILGFYKDQQQTMSDWQPKIGDETIIQNANLLNQSNDVNNPGIVEMINFRTKQHTQFLQRNIQLASINNDALAIITALTLPIQNYNVLYAQLSKIYADLQTKIYQYSGDPIADTYYTSGDNFQFPTLTSSNTQQPQYLQLIASFASFVQNQYPLLMQKFWRRATSAQLQTIAQGTSNDIDKFLSNIKENINDIGNVFYFNSTPFSNSLATNVAISNHFMAFLTSGQKNIFLKIKNDLLDIYKLFSQTVNRSIEYFTNFMPILMNGSLYLAQDLINSDTNQFLDVNLNYKVQYNAIENHFPIAILIYDVIPENFYIYYDIIRGVLVYTINNIQNSIVIPNICFCFKQDYIFHNVNNYTLIDFTQNPAKKLNFNSSTNTPILTVSTSDVTMQAYNLPISSNQQNIKNLYYFGFASQTIPDSKTHVSYVKFDINIGASQMCVQSKLQCGQFNQILLFCESQAYVIVIFNNFGYEIQHFSQNGIDIVQDNVILFPQVQ